MAIVKRTRLQNGEVQWNINEVVLLLEQVTADVLEAAAFAIEDRAKMNIVANDQVDTGFMLNSVYSAGQGSEGLNTYLEAEVAARAQNPNGFMLAEETPPDDGLTALVAVGAEYAIFQEEMNSFLYRALEQEVTEFGGKLEEKAKEAGTW